MKTYNEHLKQAVDDFERVINIAYSKLREREYALKDQYLKEQSRLQIESLHNPTTTVSVLFIQYEVGLKQIQHELEDLSERRKRFMNTISILKEGSCTH